MSKKEVVSTQKDIRQLRGRVLESSRKAVRDLKRLASEAGEMKVFHELRFRQVGTDPLDLTRPLNFIEQLNQAFTYLVALRAAGYLLENEPMHAPYTLNFGTTRGHDIAAEDGLVVAEVFAATNPNSNRKLKKDMAKVRRSSAPKKFVFYYCVEYPEKAPSAPDVHLVRFKSL